MNLAVVYGFGKARETIQRHLPFWRRFCDDLVLYCPEDDPARIDGVTERLHGRSEWTGPSTIDRVRVGLLESAAKAPDRLLVYEYDSLFWDIPPGLLPPPGAVAAYHRRNKKILKYKAPRYVWFPQIWDGAALQKAVPTLQEPDLSPEHGFSDRFVGWVIHKAGVPVKNIGAAGYSQHTIDSRSVLSAVRAIRKGVCYHHGIKTRPVLARLWQEWRAVHPTQAPDLAF